MNIIRFYSTLVLLCLFFTMQRVDAQCDITLSADVTDIACFGDAGSIGLTVSGGEAPYTFSWSDGQTDEDITGLSGGLYIVTVSDNLGCIANLARNVTGPDFPLNLVLNDDGMLSCLNFYSEIVPDISGGTEPYNFLWSTGNTNSALSASVVGTYTVTITDANACTISASKTISQSPGLPIADAGPDEIYISCSTAPNLIGGPNTSTGPEFTYTWENFIGGFDPGTDTTQPVIEATNFGVHILTVTNTVEGCSTSDIITVLVDGSFPTVSIQNPSILSCPGDQITLNATGSSTGPDFSYLWTTSNGQIVSGANTLSPVVDAPGNYVLAITNNLLGCVKRGQVNVVSSQNTLVANAGPDTGIPCGGNQVTLDGSGSSNGLQYTYLWTTTDGNILAGTNTLNPLVNQPGTYTILVLDTQNGCTRTDDVKVYPGPVIPAADLSVLDVSCTGQLGIAAVNMSQGTGPYTYLWSNDSTQAAIINIFQGTYTVTVTDATGCDYFGEVEVKDTSTLMLSALVTMPTCIVGNDGAIDLTAIGFFGPFEYAWNTGETTQDLSNLSAGTYTVTVTYAGGSCTETLSVTLTDSSSLTLSTLVTQVVCNGNDGAIDLSITGGTPPYNYLWAGGETTQDIVGLSAGTYSVTVADAMGCTKTASATVGQTPGFTLSAVITTSTVCTGANGAIDLSVAPLGSYIYSWSNGFTSQDPTGLPPGNYTVTVTDGALCTSVETYTIADNPNLPMPSAVPTPTTCDLSNGSIDASVTGGVAPFNYLWTINATTQDISNIPSGNYILTVTGANGCTNTISVDVTNSNPSFNIIEVIFANNVCNGTPNGSINLTVLPIGSYNYSWSSGAIGQSINGLISGTYGVTVSAGGSCTLTEVYFVPDQSNAPDISSSISDATCNGSDGAIDLTVSGGTPNYTYEWSNGSLTEDLAGIPAGNYMVTVTDAAGCAQMATMTVGQISDLALSTVVTNVLCFGGSNGAIDLNATGSNGPFTYLWSNNATTQDLNGLVAGTYTVTVFDALGCTKTGSATVGQPTDLSLSWTINTVSCFGGNNGAINLTTTGGTPAYTFAWSNFATTQDLTGLVAGTYTVTVTDINGCTRTGSATVNQPADLVLSTVITPVTCFGGSDGVADLTVIGGTPGYTYQWCNGATTQDLTNMPVIIMCTVTVTDLQGCFEVASATIHGSVPLIFTIVSLSNTCSSETITGPNLPNLIHQWTGPNGFTATTAAITANVSGLYTLVITDQNGCTASDDFNVNLSGGGACGAIKGRLYHDEDESCALNFGEPGLAGWIVRAEGANDTLYGVTNAQGQYLVGVPIGTYAMKVFVPNGLWTICPGGILATVGMVGDTVSGGDFPVQSTYICPALTVSIGTDKLRRCFANNHYQVEYCNQGTQKAEDAYITVVLDQFLTVISASVPYIDLGSNALHFEVGDLEIGECGAFSIQVIVNCNAVLGQTHCTQAFIYPDTLCAPPNTNWSGASLSLKSVCTNDSLQFILRNDGKATMSTTREYIVVEDGIMFRSGTLAPLAENDSMIITVPANGSTWRVEVDQEAFHPYASPVGLSVEACVASASFSTGFVNQFPYNDEPPTVDVDCTTNIGSFDPNDKYGYPVGYGADHYIRPGTDIEYLIRFQNTGTDTAFTVQIIDTLSAWLDPSTIRFGASSHPYRYDLNGEGIVHFIFEDIFLPDSNTNEVASNGFAKFIIKPRLDAPLETIIENTAAIYFDFNDPVFTNTTFHRLGNNFVTVGLWQPEMPEAKVIAMPNPFHEQTILEVKGLVRNTGLRLQVFDLRGNVVHDMESENEFFQLKKGDWPSGIYLFKITQHGRLVGNGKLMAE